MVLSLLNQKLKKRLQYEIRNNTHIVASGIFRESAYRFADKF